MHIVFLTEVYLGTSSKIQFYKISLTSLNFSFYSIVEPVELVSIKTIRVARNVRTESFVFVLSIRGKILFKYTSMTEAYAVLQGIPKGKTIPPVDV